MPPEIALLPRWFYFNLYAMSAWSRTIVVPLAILWAAKPARPVPPAAGLAELATGLRPSPPSRTSPPAAVGHPASPLIDWKIKLAEAVRLTPLRRRALARSEAWIRERLVDSDGLGAIFPPIVNSVFALTCLGYPADDPLLAAQIAELEKLVVDEGDTVRLQPCFSAVWDTALAATALAGSGLPAGHPALAAATRWLVDREVRRAGDWTVQVPGVEPSGWVFEYANDFYPDCDDTAQVLTALAAAAPSERRAGAAARRGGAPRPGLAAGDAEPRRRLGCVRPRLRPRGAHPHPVRRPQRDDRPLDRRRHRPHPGGARPTSASTARTRRCGRPRPICSTSRRRTARGTAAGASTTSTAPGWRSPAWPATGRSPTSPGAGGRWRWIASCQNLDGGWGESPRSYDEPEQKGRGPSTAAQTAWALLALLAAGVEDGPALRRGVDYLLRTQRDEGGWVDEPWTGTGFPKVFYLRYRLYATYFPLLALARYEAQR